MSKKVKKKKQPIKTSPQARSRWTWWTCRCLLSAPHPVIWSSCPTSAWGTLSRPSPCLSRSVSVDSGPSMMSGMDRDCWRWVGAYICEITVCISIVKRWLLLCVHDNPQWTLLCFAFVNSVTILLFVHGKDDNLRNCCVLEYLSVFWQFNSWVSLTMFTIIEECCSLLI